MEWESRLSHTKENNKKHIDLFQALEQFLSSCRDWSVGMAMPKVAILLYMWQYMSNISMQLTSIKNSDSILFNLCLNVLY